MCVIHSNYNYEITIERINKALIEYDYFNPGMPGFIGRLDNNSGKLWIVNHMNTITTRKGVKYRSYRRFTGYVIDNGEKATIEGKFLLRPLYSLTLIVFAIFIVLFNALTIMFSQGVKDIVTIAGSTMLLAILIAGTMLYNVKKAEECDEEIIEFISSLIIVE